MNLQRLFRHLLMPRWWVLRHFDKATQAAIGQAVAAAERQHRGELRWVVEGSLPLLDLLRHTDARRRAIDLFARLRIWDTSENSGILIYVQLADRRVEILADRGIAARVPQVQWDTLCRTMESAFAAGNYRNGAVQAIAAAGALLREHFPAASDHPNELPDRPLVL